MCCASIFTCIMAMVSNFSVIFIFGKFLSIYFYKYNIPLHLGVILVLFLLTATSVVFFISKFFKINCIFCVFLKIQRKLLKIQKTFSCNLLRGINYAYFLQNQMPKQLIQNIRRRYVFLFFVFVGDFSRLFLQLSIFPIKDSMSAYEAFYLI